MRNNKGSYVFSTLISIALLIVLAVTGVGMFAYVTALVLLGLNILVGLANLVTD